MLTTEWWWVGNIDENKERDFFNSNARTHTQTNKQWKEMIKKERWQYNNIFPPTTAATHFFTTKASRHVSARPTPTRGQEEEKERNAKLIKNEK